MSGEALREIVRAGGLLGGGPVVVMLSGGRSTSPCRSSGPRR